MHGHGGQAVILLLLLLLCGGALLRTVRTARRARGPQSRPQARARARAGGGWLAHRRALRLERVRHENAAVRDAAKHRHRLAEQEARRARQGEDPGGDGGRPGRRTVRSRVVRYWDGPAGPGDAPGPSGSGPGEPPPPPAQDPPPPRGAPWASPRPGPHDRPAREGSGPRPVSPVPGPPPPQPPQPSQPSRSSGGSTVTAAPFAESVIDGINSIAAHARTGNILAKRRAMLALIAICQRAASMALSLSRALAEPGQHYGPEVTEPIAKGAMHLTAASTAFAEADTALTTLLRASVSETMESGRQFPHHDELVR